MPLTRALPLTLALPLTRALSLTRALPLTRAYHLRGPPTEAALNTAPGTVDSTRWRPPDPSINRL